MQVDDARPTRCHSALRRVPTPMNRDVMFDLTGTETTRNGATRTVQRPSFRRRLFTMVGPALAAALAVPALLAWAGAYWSFHHTAMSTVETEAEEMLTEARIVDGSLDLSAYAWQEAHHRLAIDRVDPIFVQVFNDGGQLLRESSNINALDPSFPDRLLADQMPERVVPSLKTFAAGDRGFYYTVRPIPNRNGQVAGFVQVSRAVPDHRSMLWQLGMGLIALWVALTIGLLVLVDWAARRVSTPLRRVTDVARTITSADLDTRVHVPDDADRETAMLSETLNALLDRVQSHVDALRTFTSNAAHELQTPLTVLRGHVEIALRRDRSAAEYRSTLELLDDRLGSFVQTLRALLTLTRLDRGASLETEEVDMVDLVAEEVQSFQQRADQRHIQLTVEAYRQNEGHDATGPNGRAAKRTPPDGRAFHVQAQPDLLRDAVRNLVDNALKYTQAGSVHVAVEADEDSVHVLCRDTGIGIDEEEITEISNRFYRGTRAGDVGGEGSGLGLSMVTRIVERHQGRLQVHSERGKRTEFRITLPR